MNATTMTINKMWNSHIVHSTHALSSLQEADDSAQSNYDRPIHSQKLIPDSYDRDDDDRE